MKTGKYISLGEYKNIKIGYGTVDFRNLKTIYLKFNSWVQPKKKDVEFEDKIISTQRAIKFLIMDLNNPKFKKESIVDLDLRTKGIKIDKRSFVNLEVTLYVDQFFDLKSNESKVELNKLFKTIIDTILVHKSPFNFYKTKK